jgi:hypothetical protein
VRAADARKGRKGAGLWTVAVQSVAEPRWLAYREGGGTVAALTIGNLATPGGVQGQIGRGVDDS